LGTTTTNSSNLENDRQPFEQHQEIKKLLDYNQKYSSIVNKNLFEYFNRNDNKRYSVSELNANNLKTDVGKFSIINEFHKRNRREIVDERQAATATTANVANKEIFLNLTRILDLSKQNLTQLSELDCLKNAKNVENILMLNVSYNLLTTFNINNLNNFTELSILDLSSNLIEELNLSHSVISEIYLSGNLLRNLTTGDLYNLKYLNLSCNKFNDSKQIVFRNNLTKLEKLDLSWNQLREIHNKLFFNVTNLIELNLSNNQLSELRKNLFYHLQNLEILNLSNNDISQIDNDTFANLPILQYLDLSNNDIQTTSIRSLQGIPELIGLSISGNLLLADHLQGFVESWSIKELDISDIGLCRVPFALAQSVRILNLRGNLLSVSIFKI
jgi:Leucine-rich repeat (LRR) protein